MIELEWHSETENLLWHKKQRVLVYPLNSNSE